MEKRSKSWVLQRKQAKNISSFITLPTPLPTTSALACPRSPGTKKSVSNWNPTATGTENPLGQRWWHEKVGEAIRTERLDS